MQTMNRSGRWLTALVLLTLLSFACRAFGSSEPQGTEAGPALSAEGGTGAVEQDSVEVSPQEAFPIAGDTGPGMSRANPYPLGELVSLPGWDITVLAFLRGADTQEVLAANGHQVDAPPEGMEYVLAQVRLRCTAEDGKMHSLGISEMHMTGSSNITFGDTLDGWPAPEFLFEDMAAPEMVDGWVDAVVPVSETDLELALNLQESGPLNRFFELSPGASIRLPAGLASLEPNSAGSSFADPARAGTAIITPDWMLELLESYRGAQAERTLQVGGITPPTPGPGLEVVLLRVRLTGISRRDFPLFVSAYNFTSLDRDGFALQYDRFLPPAFSDLDWFTGNLYPGGSTEGWILVQGTIGEDALVSVNFTTDERYLAVAP